MEQVLFFSLILLSVLPTGSIAQDGPRVESSGGELQFTDFQPFCEYEAPNILNTPPSSASFGNIAAGFIRAVAPGSLASILEQISLDELMSEQAAQYIQGNYSTFFNAFVAIPIFFLLGIVLALLVPFCGCIFCCCRCCGNCGGKREQYDEDNVLWKRCILVFLLLAVAILLGVGTASVFLGGSTLTGTFDTALTTVDATASDLNCYVNSILKEFEYLVAVADDTVQIAVREVQGTSEEVTQLIDEVEMVFYNISQLVDSAQRLNDSLSLVSEVRTNEMNLRMALSEFSSSYDMTLNSPECAADTACSNANNNKDLTVFSVTTTLESLADVSSQQQSLNNFLAGGLSAAADRVLRELEPIRNVFKDGNFIPTDVFNASSLNSLTGDSIGEIDTVFNDFSDILGNLESVAADVTQYGFISSAVLASLVGLICVLYILGIIFGEIGRKRHDVPEERVCLAKCGGCLLVVGWVFSFLFYFIVALLAASYFLFGSMGEVFLCQTLQTPSSLDAIKDAIVGLSNTSDADIFSQISISSAVEQCEMNGPLWQALNLDAILGDDVTAALNDLQNSLDVASDIEAINVSEVLNFEKQTFLSYLESINFATVNFTRLSSELGKSPVGDLSSEADKINNSAAAVTNDTLKAALQGHATRLREIISNELAAFNDSVNALRPEIGDLQTEANQISTTAGQVARGVANISVGAADVVLEALIGLTPKLLDYGSQTLDYVLSQIRTNVGRCQPIHSVYRSIEYILCDNLINSMNAMWLGFGIAVIFFIFGIIFAVKLSKYYKLMYSVGDENYENVAPGQEGYPNYNKNYPV